MKVLVLGTLVLGCVLVAVAENPSTTCNCPQDQASHVHGTTVQGCLLRSKDGSFRVADISGGVPDKSGFQVRGDSAQLSSYVGKEVRVTGVPITDNGSTPDSMPMSMSMASTGATALAVSSLQEVHSNCNWDLWR